mmetsp:Transcript_9855/g.24982  ORF Transcript_9855/g.24982 Transcript_9855/m.24982 type:complete len:281 (+) Transcript_9855:79-921(+)
MSASVVVGMRSSTLMSSSSSLSGGGRVAGKKQRQFGPLLSSSSLGLKRSWGPSRVGGLGGVGVSRRRLRASSSSSSSRSSSSSSSVSTSTLKSELLDFITPLSRGLDASSEDVMFIRGMISSLAEAQQAQRSSEDSSSSSSSSQASLTGSWKLTFTSEQETLFILKNAALFGTEAGDVWQVIDDDANLLQNVITFPPAGRFQVNSSLQTDESKSIRRNFKFNQAKLVVGDADWNHVRTIPFPPYGQGWFDNVYLDEDLRCAEDSRGDVLVVQRCPLRLFE